MQPSPNDADWYDRMYNNRAMVPDNPAYMERWAKASVHVRASQPCTLDIAYGGLFSETLDVFTPTSAHVHADADATENAGAGAGAPVLVFIHGGYWRALDKSDHSFVAPAFTTEGCVVVVVNYALCPGTPDAPVSVALIGEQMERALQWIWDHIADYGGDPVRITVAGHSAGGQLAALMLATPWPLRAHRLPEQLVRNALSISGLHDLEPLMHSPLLQSALRLTPEEVQRCSPSRQPPPAHAWLVCAVGGDESGEFLRQNQLMREAWGKHAVRQSVALPGLHHFSVLDTFVEPGKPLHAMALQLLGVAA